MAIFIYVYRYTAFFDVNTPKCFTASRFNLIQYYTYYMNKGLGHCLYEKAVHIIDIILVENFTPKLFVESNHIFVHISLI